MTIGLQLFTLFDAPDLRQARRVLSVQPHYDDNDIAAGGTLAALADAGADLIYLTVTDDLVGVVDPHLPDDQAAAQLKHEQMAAARIIGIRQQEWLGFPDAGDYNYFELRRQVIRAIRLYRPDFLFTCDPWLPYEAHRDHIQTGLAVAEASYLHAMPRLKSDPLVDAAYQPYELAGVAFYFSQAANTSVDIGSTFERKHQAVACYQAQFTTAEMARLLERLEAAEKKAGAEAGFVVGERFKVLRPAQLHLDTNAWKS